MLSFILYQLSTTETNKNIDAERELQLWRGSITHHHRENGRNHEYHLGHKQNQIVELATLHCQRRQGIAPVEDCLLKHGQPRTMKLLRDHLSYEHIPTRRAIPRSFSIFSPTMMPCSTTKPKKPKKSKVSPANVTPLHQPFLPPLLSAASSPPTRRRTRCSLRM